MRITVTTTSQNLNDILTSTQKEQANNVREEKNMYDLEFQNKGTDTVYIELGGDAVVNQTTEVEANGTYSFSIEKLSNVHLISSAENSSVNVLIK